MKPMPRNGFQVSRNTKRCIASDAAEWCYGTETIQMCIRDRDMLWYIDNPSVFEKGQEEGHAWHMPEKSMLLNLSLIHIDVYKRQV